MAVGAGMAMGRGQRGPPQPTGRPNNAYGNTYDLPRNEAPPPGPGLYNGYGDQPPQLHPVDSHESIGQALPMDAVHGSPARSPISPPANNGNGPGMVGMHQDRRRNSGDDDAKLSPTSVYSPSEEYVD